MITHTISVDTYGPQCTAQVLFVGPVARDQAPRADIPHYGLRSDGCAERGTWLWVGGKAGAETPHSRMLGISSTESAGFYTETDTPTRAQTPLNSCAMHREGFWSAVAFYCTSGALNVEGDSLGTDTTEFRRTPFPHVGPIGMQKP